MGLKESVARFPLLVQTILTLIGIRPLGSRRETMPSGDDCNPASKEATYHP